MQKRTLLLSGIMILALAVLTGACAAEETPSPAVTAALTGQQDSGVPEPVPDGSTEIADDIPPYDGPLGPGNPLYGLKIAFEDLDESFTFNETERLNKQLNSAKLRLSEVKRELALNSTGTADRALELYRQKINETQMRLAVSSSSNATGLVHAQEMAMQHQLVLERLVLSHPDSPGLARAYTNSRALQETFEEKTQTRFERVLEKNNATIVKAVKLEIRERERTGNAGEDQAVQVRQTEKVRQAEGNGKENGKGDQVTTSDTPAPVSPSETPPSVRNGKPDDAGNGGTTTTPTGDGSGNGNAGSDNRGQGNGRNR